LLLFASSSLNQLQYPNLTFFFKIKQADLPMTAEYDASGAGRTPSVVDLKKKDK